MRLMEGHQMKGEGGALPTSGRNTMEAREGQHADAESVQDLLGQVLSNADKRLIDIYGDTIHQNNGCYLHG